MTAERPQHRKRMRRFERPNHARYLTFSCYGREPLFRNDAIKSLFVQYMTSAREEFQFQLIAWVVMPEHAHLLLVPQLPEHPVSEVLREMKKRFAKRVIARWRELDAPILRRLVDSSGVTHFWLPGGGYDRNTLAGHELPEKTRYIHNNPVRRGLVASPTEWPWSSARAYAGDPQPMAPIDFVRLW